MSLFEFLHDINFCTSPILQDKATNQNVGLFLGELFRARWLADVGLSAPCWVVEGEAVDTGVAGGEAEDFGGTAGGRPEILIVFFIVKGC